MTRIGGVFFEIKGKLKEMGYHAVKELWYKVGKGSVLQNKLKLLCDDKGALHMADIARRNGNVHLFIVHIVSEAEVVDNFLEYYPLGDDNIETGHGNVKVQGEMDCDSACVGGNNGEAELQDGGNNDKEVHSEQSDGGDKVVDPELQDDANNETCKDGMEDDGNNPDEVGYDKVDGGDKVHDDGNNEACKDRMDDDVQGDMQGRHDEGVEDVEVHSWTKLEPHIADGTGDQELEGLVDVNVAYDGDATDDHNLCEDSVEVDLYVSEGSQESKMGLSDNEWVSDHLDSGEESEETVGKEENTKSSFMNFRMPINMEDY